MRLIDQIVVLEVSNQMGTVYPVLIRDGQGLYLVDTGFPSQYEALQSAIQDAGHSMDQITGVILTHQDLDHIGNIVEVKKASPRAKVYAHIDEAPFIEGSQTPVKVAKLESQFDEMPAEQKQFFSEYKKAFENRRTPIDIKLSDGDPMGETIRVEVIHTPGHTPGHICLYVHEKGLLISGDALNVRDGNLVEPSPEHTQNRAQALHSVRRMQSLPIQTVVCFHGGVFSVDDIPRRLQAIANQ